MEEDKIEIISYKTIKCLDYIHGDYVTVTEYYIPQEKICFYDKGINVYYHDGPNISPGYGPGYLCNLDQIDETIKQQIINSHNIKLKNYQLDLQKAKDNSDIKNIFVDLNFIKDIKLFLEVKKRLQDQKSIIFKN